MRVLVTGADGFIGKNLQVALRERDGYEVLPVTRDSSHAELVEMAARADVVVHLAGVNRPQAITEFTTGNVDFTTRLCQALLAARRPIPVAFASSTQAELDNAYGVSKRAAEDCLTDYGQRSGSPVALYRLTNVFGKWSRPNYNSVVATFCYSIARGLPVHINDALASVKLVYVDDVIAEFIRFLDMPGIGVRFAATGPAYETTVGDLANEIQSFRGARDSLLMPHVGAGLTRALYATYVSFLPPNAFCYSITKHGDARGVFVEMLKTPDCGQFSFFTAHPGVTRGGHYHHTKTEKFLVLKGSARYRFRHLVSGETHTIDSIGDEPLVVESIPGWAHDITNIGQDELVVMLWANEVFDRMKPDTVASPL